MSIEVLCSVQLKTAMLIHLPANIQYRSKISEHRIRVPYASYMRMRMLSYAYVLPLSFIAIPLLYVALYCTTKETVK